MLQIVTLDLDITAADYLAWCYSPDAAIDVPGLVSSEVVAMPFDDAVTAVLEWDDEVIPPAPERAAALAGLQLTADVRTRSSQVAYDRPGRILGQAAKVT